MRLLVFVAVMILSGCRSFGSAGSVNASDAVGDDGVGGGLAGSEQPLLVQKELKRARADEIYNFVKDRFEAEDPVVTGLDLQCLNYIGFWEREAFLPEFDTACSYIAVFQCEPHIAVGDGICIGEYSDSEALVLIQRVKLKGN